MSLCKLNCNDTTAKVNFCVAVRPDLSWVVTYCNNTVDPEKCAVLKVIPPMMNSGTNIHIKLCMHSINVQTLVVSNLQALLNLLDVTQPCCGNSDDRFLSLSSLRKGTMLDKSS